MTFDEELNRTFDTITGRLRAEIALQVHGAIVGLSAQAQIDRDRAAADARAAVEAGAHERAPIPSFDRAPTDRLRDAIRGFAQARTLTDTLALLMASAAREATRVAVLLVQGGRLRVWRLAGFPPLPGDGAVPGTWGSVAEAWRTNSVVMCGRPGTFPAPAFAELPEGREGVAVPIALCGDVVAVLYADRGTAHAQPPSPAWADIVELLTRYAAVGLEALTAFKTARALMGPQEDAAPAAAGDVTSGDAASGGAAAARRYARLLVSEIKLYHEAAVVAGRRNGDLLARLGEEIARARVLYERRVPPPVRQHADSFHEELVRTLANGDASLLEVRT